MIKLYNTADNSLVGDINEDELDFLIEQLEEEFLEDKDYYFNQATIDLLAADGRYSHLVTLLSAVPHTDSLEGGFELRWSRM